MADDEKMHDSLDLKLVQTTTFEYPLFLRTFETEDQRSSLTLKVDGVGEVTLPLRCSLAVLLLKSMFYILQRAKPHRQLTKDSFASYNNPVKRI